MNYELIILKSLLNTPKHGYEIKKELENSIGVIYSISNNTLYPILRKLEKVGATTKKEFIIPGKPTRNEYTITNYGKSLFLMHLKNIKPNTVQNRDDFFSTMGCFDYMDVETRTKLINERKELIINASTIMKEKFNDSSNIISTFYIDVIELELKLLDTYLVKLNDPTIEI